MINSRQLEVLMILLAKKRTTAKEIAKLLEVSTRTVERCIDSLSLRGVPVTTQRGRNGGIAIDHKYKMDAHLFTASDIRELFTATNIYNHIFDTQFQEEMREKICLLNPDSIETIDKITKKFFVVDLYEEKLSINKEIQEVIAAALLERNLLKIRTEKSDWYIVPVCYVLKKEGMYLYGYDGVYRLIAIKAIKEIKASEKMKITLPEEFILYKENKFIYLIEN